MGAPRLPCEHDTSKPPLVILDKRALTLLAALLTATCGNDKDVQATVGMVSGGLGRKSSRLAPAGVGADRWRTRSTEGKDVMRDRILGFIGWGRRRRLTLTLGLVVSVAGLAVFMITNALAVHDLKFELDGNVTTQGKTAFETGTYDW